MMLTKISDWTLRPRSATLRWSIAGAAFVVSVALRHALDDWLPPGFPYLTFFPAVILTAFFAGVREASVLAALCGVVAWYFFIAPERSFALAPTSAVALAFYLFIVATDIFLVLIATRALARLKAEQERARALAESRGLMFQELQHRVSNHLQVVASLLKFQRRQVTDESAQHALDNAAQRLALVARIQRQLHDPTSQTVDLARFLREMSRDVLEATGAGERVRIDLDAEPVRLSGDQAVPFGLIATELMSNAVEHGFSGGASGRIAVALAGGSDGEVTLRVADYGRGLPDGFDLDSTTSLGLMIARQFAGQLGGSLVMRTNGGTEATLTFPLAESRPAAA